MNEINRRIDSKQLRAVLPLRAARRCRWVQLLTQLVEPLNGSSSLRRLNKKPGTGPGFLFNGALGRIRTSDRLVRSQVLYPAELQALDSSVFLAGEGPCEGALL